MKLEIIVENTGKRNEYKQGTSLHEIAQNQIPHPEKPILGAFVNNITIPPLFLKLDNASRLSLKLSLPLCIQPQRSQNIAL